MKDTELKLLSELIKNSRRSDRELAKAIDVSQPTVSRVRLKLEKEGILDYTAIPNLAKLGYGLVAVILGKRNYDEHPEIHVKKAAEFVRKHPNIIFGATGNGLGYDRISISIHKSYSGYAKFVREIRTTWSGIMDVESFLIDLTSKDLVQPLSLKQFAHYLEKGEKLE